MSGPPSAPNIAQTFVQRAQDWSGRLAIVSPRLVLTYSGLSRRAARGARELRELGVAPGANIGIALRDGGEAAALMLSLWMLGAVPVPIDFRTRPAERMRLIEEFDLAAMLEDRPAPQESGYRSILVDDDWAERIAKHGSEPFFAGSPETPAIVSLTSGTTDRPAGIVIGHEALMFRFAMTLREGRRRLGGRLLNAFPISSSSPRNHTFARLLDGATVFSYPAAFSPGDLVEAVRANDITYLCVVPTMLRGLLDLAGERDAPLLGRLDALHCFGAPALPEEKRRAKASLSDYFIEGLSSTLTGRISLLSGGDIDARPETVGRVLPHVALEIVDDADRPVPRGVPGLIRVRTPSMAQAIYGGRVRESGDKIKQGWAYPGDIGAVDDDGFLQLHGRSSDLIIRGGTNVHPAEVESVIAGHEAVQDVAVVGFSKLPEGEEIAAFVVSSAELSEAALMAYCRERLAPDKYPRKFVFLAALPRNANGKVLRAELRNLLRG